MLNWNNSWVDDARISSKLQQAEFGLFAAVLCAEASFEKLCTVAKSFAWVSWPVFRCVGFILLLLILTPSTMMQYFIWDDSKSNVLCLTQIPQPYSPTSSCWKVFDCGALKYNSEGAKRYRQASIKYFEHQLLLDRDLPNLSLFPLELQKALLCWDEVGSHIREVCSEGMVYVLPEMLPDHT